MPSRLKRIFKGLLLIAIASAAVILGAVACWVYPDVSSLRAICAASANSVYPAHVVRAIVAAEDPQFLGNSHHRTGASTLVEQWVKSQSVPTRQITWLIKRLLVAAVIERTVPKSQIVAAYLDHVYLGSVGGKHLYGVPAGARAYFGRTPRELTLAQAAMLAGIIRSPRQYSPIEHPERAAARQQVVLEKMRTLKFITDADFDTAIRQSATAKRN